MSEVLDRMINEGYNKGISEGEARGISIGEARAKKAYEEELAILKARLAKYEAQELSN